MGRRTTQHGIQKKKHPPAGPIWKGLRTSGTQHMLQDMPGHRGNVSTHVRKFISHGGPQQERSPRTLGRPGTSLSKPKSNPTKGLRGQMGCGFMGARLGGTTCRRRDKGAFHLFKLARNPHQGKSFFFSARKRCM